MSYCKECDKIFSTEHKLILHLKTSNNHKEENPKYCEICDKIFASSQSCNNHKNIFHLNKKVDWKELYIIEQNKGIDYKKQINEYKKQIKVCKELEIHNQKLKEELIEFRSRYEELKERINDPKNVIIHNTNNDNSTKITFKNINKVTQNLNVIKDSELNELFRQFTTKHLLMENKDLARLFNVEYFHDKLICSDLSRGTLRWKDESGQQVKDKKGMIIKSKVANAGQSNLSHLSDLLNKLSISINNTCPEEIIEVNNAVSKVSGLSNANSKLLNELFKFISEDAKQLTSGTNLKHLLILSLKNVKDIKIGLKGYLEEICNWFTRLDTIDPILDLNQKKIYAYSFSNTTLYLDPEGNIVYDKEHIELFSICFEVYQKLKKDICPFALSTEEEQMLYKGDKDCRTIYQSCFIK